MTQPHEDPETPPELIEGITRALSAAARNNDEGLRATMREVADIYFPAGLGYACFVWARAAAAAILGSPEQLLEYNAATAGDGPTAGVQFLLGDRVVNAEETDATTRFVGRMIAFAFNDDDGAARDMWGGLDGKSMAECSMAMVSFAASMIAQRTLIDLKEAPGAVS